MSDVMIEARDLTKTYGSMNALKDVSFEVRKGEVVGFLGPNGAGKTTTMKILTCFIAPSGGSAKIDGRDIWDDPMGVRESIGYLPESTPLYTEMLVLEYLEFIAKMRGFKGIEIRKRIKKAVEQTSLGDVIAKEIRSLSKGFKQRVGLAQALIHEPSVLILDEPMSGLDPNQAAEIRELIKDIGRERTVVLSTHDLAEVQVTCDRVLIISKGRLVADDTPDELRERTGKAQFVVTVKGDDDKKVRDILGAIGGVSGVKARTGEVKGESVYWVAPKGSEDLRAPIFQAAVKGELTLLGLERRSEGLDQVFRDLTTGTAEPAKKAKKSSKKASKASKRDTNDTGKERPVAKAEAAEDSDASAGSEEE